MNSVPVEVIEISSSSESDSAHSVVEVLSSSDNESAALDADPLQWLDYKGAIRDAVHELASVGTFATHGKLDRCCDPQVSITGVGSLVFPLPQQRVAEVIACMEQAPFGMGSATVLDLSVRTAWQLDAAEVTTGAPFLPK